MLEYCQVLTSISMVDARGHSFVFVLAKSDEERGIVHAVEDFCKGNAFKPLEPCIEGLLWNLGEQGYDGWASWYASRQGAGATLRDDAFRQSLDQLAAARTGRFAAGTARNNLSTTEWGRGIWDLVAVPEHLLRRFSAEVVPFPKSLPVPIDPCAAKCEPANPMISSANTRWGTEIVVNMSCTADTGVVANIQYCVIDAHPAVLTDNVTEREEQRLATQWGIMGAQGDVCSAGWTPWKQGAAIPQFRDSVDQPQNSQCHPKKNAPLLA